MEDHRRRLHRYAAGVTAAGLAVFAFIMVRSGQPAISEAFGDLWLFTLFVIVGQLLPVRLPGGHDREVSIATTFAFALLLTAGPAPAMVAVVAAGGLAAVSRRRPALEAAFTTGAQILALAAGGAVVAMSGLERVGGLLAPRPWALPVALAAAGAYLLVSGTATGMGHALTRAQPILPSLRRSLALDAPASAVLLALAPVVVAASERSPWMVPLLGVPMIVIHKRLGVWLDREAHRHGHDSLTGLPSRRAFCDLVRSAVAESDRRGPFAVMIIDLDRFKEINDTLGHQAGDVLLGQIGPRLRSILREGDVIGRLGGDEFAVLVPDVPSDASALRVAERIQEALETPFTVESLLLDVDASIGIALYPDHGVSLQDLMRHAEVAMYMAKESHSRYELYAPERDQHSPRRLALLGELRRALNKGELVVHYQPKADLKSGRVVAAEALVRWIHPQHGIMPPDTFIPLAERTGLMRQLTLFVLNTALRQCREWHAMGHRIGVAVNLSARNLLDLRFPDEVERLLSTWQVSPQWLELEITESAVMVDPHRALHVLARLSELGVGTSLDDFGTGYSSLAYLKRLPVSEVKIDKSFITHMVDEDDDALIVESTIRLARSLGLRVVAEGVETEEVWQLLTALGCDMAQGYYLSRPMPPVELGPWLRGAEPQRVVRLAT